MLRRFQFRNFSPVGGAPWQGSVGELPRPFLPMAIGKSRSAIAISLTSDPKERPSSCEGRL